MPYLKSRKWDTRTAAAKAISGIAESCPLFEPNGDEGDDTKTELDDTDAELLPAKMEEDEADSVAQDQLRLETLDLGSILVHGKKLLGSSGQQYDYALAYMDPSQRLVHQKKSLNARLGLAGEYTDEELINERDVKNGRATPLPGMHKLNTAIERNNSTSDQSGLLDTATPQTPGDGSSLSKRQLNMLKRKNKRELKDHANKVRVVDFSERRPSYMQSEQIPLDPEPGGNETNGHVDHFTLDRAGGDDQLKVVQEFKGEQVPIKSEFEPEADEIGIDWPFERLCEHLMVDMFDHNWEIRHGAAMALRDVLRVHGGSAGRERGKSKAANDLLNRKWLNDLTCRLCCIFMLDRFGDYVSDNVVAPVRETAGQALGAILKYLPNPSLKVTYQILQQLVRQKNHDINRVWQAVHGGMLGLRYLVAVRTDLFLTDEGLMNDMLDVVMNGLADSDDDVRSASALTLIPVSEDVVKRRPTALRTLLRVVWDCLSTLGDDLSSSTGAVMDLLSKLCSYTEVLETMKESAAGDSDQTFTELVPRLFPFLRHIIVSVRSSALKALRTFLNIEGEGTQDWIDGRAMRLIFQNLLVERNEGVLALSLDVWQAMVEAVGAHNGQKLEEEFAPHLQPMVALTLHPIGVPRNPIPMPAGLLQRPSGQVFVLPFYGTAATPPKRQGSEPPPTKRRRRSVKPDRDATPPPVSANNIDNPMIQGDVDLVGAETLIKTRIYAAKGLAKVISLWPLSTRQDTFESLITAGLRSTYASSRITAAIASEEYGKLRSDLDDFGTALVAALRPLAEEEEIAFFAELKTYLVIAQQQCFSLRNVLEKSAKIALERLPHIGGNVAVVGEEFNKYSFCLDQGENMIGPGLDKAKSLMTPAAKITAGDQVEAVRLDAKREIAEACSRQLQCSIRVKAAASAALVAFGSVPKKPSPTIKGLMDSVKTEENVELQKRSAAGVVALVQLLVSSNRRVVVDKVVGNLVNFYCQDAAETPDFQFNKAIENGMLSLRKDEDVTDHANPAKFAQDAKDARIKRRGAREALEQMASSFGSRLFDNVPVLRSSIEAPLQEAFAHDLPDSVTEDGVDLGQRVVDSMSTLRALIPKLDPHLHSFVLEMLPKIIRAIKCRLAVLRYAAAKCLATICSVISAAGFTTLVKEVLPSINNANDTNERQGAVECVYHLIHVMEDRILPYVIFLIVPILGRMSDSDNDVRLIATTAFATLVKLVPLEAGIPDPPGLSKELLEGRERERKFMAQMLDFKKVEPFEMPVAIKAELRSYQQEGVNWLAFLNRYHLHGILCDDMGLGKTLQTLCIVASDHHLRAQEFEETQNEDVRRLPSLIICPPTLSGHWQQEIQQYAPFLKAVAYVGTPAEREKATKGMKTADIVITSYEVCRNNIEVFAPQNWNYCVLDEGHLIKNPIAKTTIAVKRLDSNHRLILSGTPIQNNVLELWSLFDFLMPGFLGTEKVFKDRFAKPIAASRYSKSSAKEQEAGALAIEALHKQVLPFLLRRLKEEVLADLPPKILQNYYCDLSELQRRLFDDFTKKAGKVLADKASSGDKEAKQHIFQALQYMRKLCNSPQLVLKPGKDDQQTQTIEAFLRSKKSDLKDPIHTPKLGALRQLLVDCGIGVADTNTSGMTSATASDELQSAPPVSQHRALIFCQMKEMLDMVQTQVLQKMLPSATFLRLDGSVETSRRQAIVNKFNSDPSIDCLLLTTSVGGLGLNLTGADTVIFVEHDWNPQKDIQAMDRAHRIGQKKVVNVHRLITRGTLEEKILNLQRFKIDVASTVVNQQNSGLATMETDQILDLFNVDEGGMAPGAMVAGEEENAIDEVTGEVKEKGKRGFLDGVEDLWDEGQYENAFNLEKFLESTKA